MKHLFASKVYISRINHALFVGLGLLLCTIFCGVESYAQLVRVPTKSETRRKQKEYSGKKAEKPSAQAALSNNAMGKRMANQSLRRNSNPKSMLVPVRDPKKSLDVNNPRNLNLNKNPIEQPLKSKNPMGMQMYRQSLKANSRAKGLLVPGPAYRDKMMKKRDKQFNSFRGEKNTLAMPDRKKMYKKKSEELSSARRGNTLAPEYRKKMYRKKSKELSSYKGDMLVRKRPKGAYPNLKYRGGYKNSSFEKKEKYRKRILKRMGKKQYVPAHMRKKDEKPKYDTRESEIWDKPR
jgi:hypothetical protein